MKNIINIKELKLNQIVMEGECAFRVIHLTDTEVRLEILGLWHRNQFTPVRNRRPLRKTRICLTKPPYKMLESAQFIRQT